MADMGPGSSFGDFSPARPYKSTIPTLDTDLRQESSSSYGPVSPGLTKSPAIPAGNLFPHHDVTIGGRERYEPSPELLDAFRAATSSQPKSDVHDSFLAEQLKHSSWSKMLSKAERLKAVKSALDVSISAEEQAAMIASMRAAPKIPPNPSATAPPSPRRTAEVDKDKTPSHLRPDKLHKFGTVELTDADFLKLVAENSNGALEERFGVTKSFIAGRRKTVLERESSRRGVSYKVLSQELTDARVANGAMKLRVPGQNKKTRAEAKRNAKKAAARTELVDLTMDDESSEPAATQSTAVQQSASTTQAVKLVPYPDSDDEMDDDDEPADSDSNDDMDTAPCTPVEEAREAIRAREALFAELTAKAIKEKMQVSALLNADYEVDEMDLS